MNNELNKKFNDYCQAIEYGSINWQKIEKASIFFTEKNEIKKAFFLYGKAENLFLNQYNKINKKDLVFLDINWEDYINYYPDLKKLNFTKLKAIRHLINHGISQGRLGKYLAAKGKIVEGIQFLQSKISEFSECKEFYLGFFKLLEQIDKLPLSEKQKLLSILSSTDFSIFTIKVQAKLLEHNIELEHKINILETNLKQIQHQFIYISKLNQANNLSLQDQLNNELQINFSQKSLVGLVSQDKSAVVGKYGWIYISSGSNQLMEYHTGQKKLSINTIEKWKEVLQSRINWHNSRNIKYLHLFVPNKVSIYPEYYPQEIKIYGDRPIFQLQKACQKYFMYPLDVFYQKKDIYQLYDKQDCHWSFWGCYFAYELICNYFGIKINEELLNNQIEIINKKGDLGIKYELLEEKKLKKKLNFNSQVVYDNELIKYCNQGSIRILKNPKVSKGKMLIFGDSFSNPGFPDYSTEKRHHHRLSSLLAETVNEVHFIWSPWIDFNYIETEKPDFVLTEMAERFMVRVPDDNNCIPVKEFATMQIKKYQEKQEL